MMAIERPGLPFEGFCLGFSSVALRHVFGLAHSINANALLLSQSNGSGLHVRDVTTTWRGPRGLAVVFGQVLHSHARLHGSFKAEIRSPSRMCEYDILAETAASPVWYSSTNRLGGFARWQY
jgi:hypothetical protein